MADWMADDNHPRYTGAGTIESTFGGRSNRKHALAFVRDRAGLRLLDENLFQHPPAGFSNEKHRTICSVAFAIAA
jgi:uncharacterized protein (DUF2141 family)